MTTKPACQLLTPIDDPNEAVNRLLDPSYALQQKFDGMRILLHIDTDSVTAHTREGLTWRLSKPILAEAQRFSCIAPVLIDSEWIREINALYAFDLLEIDGVNLRPSPFIDRVRQLARSIHAARTSTIIAARTETEQDGKVALLQQIQKHNLEGFVLKRVRSPYREGRQLDQFKFKFTHVSSFLVTRRNDKQSVDLGLYDDAGRLVDVGSVKIRDRRFNELQEGMIIDVRYRHAFKDSNQICEPRMVRIRPSKELKPSSCLLSQLRYKAVSPIAPEDLSANAQ